ncbi:hypothetical protein IWX49DRAFT_327558 [Phyllosticta citricarpa]|uniref:Uncharacterized protein n=1 Tax=Phyllosticta citricarpa TaxID=55181 RepID=A0ABR1LBB1_9PEZI
MACSPASTLSAPYVLQARKQASKQAGRARRCCSLVRPRRCRPRRRRKKKKARVRRNEAFVHPSVCCSTNTSPIYPSLLSSAHSLIKRHGCGAGWACDCDTPPTHSPTIGWLARAGSKLIRPVFSFLFLFPDRADRVVWAGCVGVGVGVGRAAAKKENSTICMHASIRVCMHVGTKAGPFRVVGGGVGWSMRCDDHWGFVRSLYESRCRRRGERSHDEMMDSGWMDGGCLLFSFVLCVLPLFPLPFLISFLFLPAGWLAEQGGEYQTTRVCHIVK